MSKLYKGESYSYTNIDNTVFFDGELTAKAKGVLCQMLSFPDGWNYSIAGLSRFFKDGRDSIRSAVKELEECGYLVRKQSFADGKFDGYDYLIFANPQNNKIADSPMTENPLTENPMTEIPMTENPTQLNTKELNTKESNTKSSSLRSEDIYSELPKNLKEALRDFEDMRKLKKKPMTNKARKMLLDRLESLSDGNTEVKIAMLNQSIENAWTSVYELKEQDNGKGNNFGTGGKGKGKTDRGIGDSEGEIFRFPDA